MGRGSNFIEFIKTTFDPRILRIAQIKESVAFIEIDCLNNQPKKELALVISDENIGFSTLEKNSPMQEDQFGLYDEYLTDFERAKEYVLEIKLKGSYIPKS